MTMFVISDVQKQVFHRKFVATFMIQFP